MEDKTPPPESDLSLLATELLLARHQQGDPRAMPKLFFRVRGRLWAAIRDHPCYPFLPAIQDEEDVFQELWLTLLNRRSLDRFEDRGPGSLRAFLHVALDRTILGICRKGSADKRGGDIPHQPIDAGASSAAGAPPPVAGGLGPASKANWNDWQDHCLGLLDGQDREVWRLRFVDDLGYATIAGWLEISEGAARSAYHRAIKKLHERGILEME